MKYLVNFIIILTIIQACKNPQTQFDTYDDYPVYQGNDLGINYKASVTIAKYWAPTASSVVMRIYQSGSGDNLIEEHNMLRTENGVWKLALNGDRSGQYYTYQSNVNNKSMLEVPGPYAKAVGVNGNRGMILNLETTNPENWENDIKPKLAGAEDIIIYELHVRDMTIHESSGVNNKGKFLGLSETGTTTSLGAKTGLDHLVELGITHIHLLPAFDFQYVDEQRLDEPQYNWGYGPQNYNVPEGSYSTNPDDAAGRIKEFKTMVQALHKNGLRVILDVVYNHTGETEKSVFNQAVPGYFYRHNTDNSWSDAAACGNETASERAMMRKYIIESVTYWAEEYHLDGFRFDLMGIHDLETMNLISEELKLIDPTIFVYGEGWTAGGSPLPDSLRALKANVSGLTSVAAFSDDLRDALKGSVFVKDERGFVSGRPGLEESIKFGIVASTQHHQVNYEQVNYSKAPWSPRPVQTISYVSCHDNNTLFDKLKLSVPEASEAELIKMHMLSQTIVLTAQGIPFLHAGTEFLRTKDGVENSYNYPDSINQIDWDRKSQYSDVFNFYRDLIALRKAHPAFRMPSTELVQKHLSFSAFEDENIVGYTLADNANGDSWKNIYIVFNGNASPKDIEVPAGEWQVILEDYQINQEGSRTLKEGNYSLAGRSALILAQN